MIDIFVVDGLVGELLDRWLDELPTFAELRTRWNGGTYRSSGNAPYEPTEMISLLTGAPSDEHGIYSYWLAQPERLGERPRVTTCADVRVPWMWESWDTNGRILCVNVPGTNKPAEFPGTIISYPMEATLAGDVPTGTLRRLMKEERKPYLHDVTMMYRGGGASHLLPRVGHIERTRGAAVNALRRRDEYEMTLVSISIIDRISHYFWAEMEQHDRESALFSAYQIADEVLAGYLAVSDGRPTLVFSEMGYGPLSGFVSFDDLLVDHGFQVRNDEGIDWASTVAYEAVQGTHGVNLCLSGRQPDGHLDPAAADGVRQEVIELLKGAPNPRTGAPLLAAVTPGATSYGPDILLKPFDERWLPLGDPRWARHVGRHRMTGWHREESVWFAHGIDSLQDGATIGSLDVASAIETGMVG